MIGKFDNVVKMAEIKTSSFERCSELLEYPEIQADKGLYLKTLSEYNELKEIVERASALKTVIAQIEKTREVLLDADGEERELFLSELDSLNSDAFALKREIYSLLGEEGEKEDLSVVISSDGEISGEAGEKLFLSLEKYFAETGCAVENVKKSYRPKTVYPKEISFLLSGTDAFKEISVWVGVHKVSKNKIYENLSLTAVTSEDVSVPFDDKDIKIDLFHSNGAGGQNINKVETAIRATHIPTGLSVTCQDERSQLKNKIRAIETLKKRVNESREKEEKARVTEERRSQLSDKRKKLRFDLDENVLTDLRIKKSFAFPLDTNDIAALNEGLKIIKLWKKPL